MPLAAIEFGMVLILVVLIALPIGAFAFAKGAGNALREIGRGQFAMDHDLPQRSASPPPVSAAVREEEIRQMVQARSDRAVARGQKPRDVDAEVEELLAPKQGTGSLARDEGLRDEVRQLVIARNERRQRQGKEPLDVDKEIERQLHELENLGQ
jgi:hypothetical protein